MRRVVMIAGCVAVLGGIAAADPLPLVDAVARHGDKDVAALRAQLAASIDPTATGAAGLGDPAVRCALGAAYLARGDLPRASIDLLDCDDATPPLPDELRVIVARATHDLPRRLRDSELAALAVDTRPTGMLAEIDDLDGERFVTPATVWVTAGMHVVEATYAAGNQQALVQTVTPAAHSHALIFLDAGPAAPAPKPGAVDFGDEEAGDAHAGPPPDIQHGSLLPKKYQQRDEPVGTLVDPMAPQVRVNSLANQGALMRHLRRRMIDLRLGGGVVSGGGVHAVAGAAIVGAWRSRTYHAWIGAPLLVVRADWTWRAGGGDADALNTFGLAIGPGFSLASTREMELRLVLAVRGELRPSAMIANAAVRNAGLGADASVELGWRALPLMFALSARQAITELAPGIHDHAIVLEVGAEL